MERIELLLSEAKMEQSKMDSREKLCLISMIRIMLGGKGGF